MIRGAASFGIDNSAHIGGLIAGVILGAVVPPVVRPEVRAETGLPDENAAQESSRASRIAWAIVATSGIILTVALVYVHAKDISVANYGKAARLIQSGQTDRAISELRQATQDDPKSVPALALLGQFLLEQQNPAAAVPPLEQSLVLDPGRVEIEHNLAIAYLGADRPADALAQIANVFDVEKDSQWAVLFIRGVAEGETSKYSVALVDLDSAFRSNPNLTEARDAIGSFQKLTEADQRPSGLRSSRQNHESTQSRPADSRDPVRTKSPAIPYSKIVMKSRYWPLFP